MYIIQTGGDDWRHGIYWDIEEISCWNLRRQLKKKCTFQGLLKGVTQFYRFSNSKALFCLEFTRVKVEFLGVIQKKIMLNFHESWFLTFEFQNGVRQFYRILKGKEGFALFRFSKGKVTNLKESGFFLKKVCLQSPSGFFWNRPAIISYVLVLLVIVWILTKRWKFKYEDRKLARRYDMANSEKYEEQFFLKKAFLKAVSVIVIVNIEKMEMKKSYPILVSPADFLKRFLPLPNFFETLSSPLKKE